VVVIVPFAEVALFTAYSVGAWAQARRRTLAAVRQAEVPEDIEDKGEIKMRKLGLPTVLLAASLLYYSCNNNSEIKVTDEAREQIEWEIKNYVADIYKYRAGGSLKEIDAKTLEMITKGDLTPEYLDTLSKFKAESVKAAVIRNKNVSGKTIVELHRKVNLCPSMLVTQKCYGGTCSEWLYGEVQKAILDVLRKNNYKTLKNKFTRDEMEELSKSNVPEIAKEASSLLRKGIYKKDTNKGDVGIGKTI
jgi:hypothetical protein